MALKWSNLERVAFSTLPHISRNNWKLWIMEILCRMCIESSLGSVRVKEMVDRPRGQLSLYLPLIVLEECQHRRDYAFPPDVVS